MRATCVVRGADGVLVNATATATATLTVERDAADPSEYGEVGGSGTLTIETGSA